LRTGHRDPFRKCKDCRLRGICRRTRRILRRYFLLSRFPRIGRIWPWESGLCPVCMLRWPYEARPDCPFCGGTGQVAERRARGTAIDIGEEQLDVALMLHRLPVRQRRVVEAWIYLGELWDMDLKQILTRLRTRPVLFRKRLCAGLMTLARAFRQGRLL